MEKELEIKDLKRKNSILGGIHPIVAAEHDSSKNNKSGKNLGEMNITLYDASGRLIPVKGNDLLIATDETGHENFADKNYPVFGMSASMCLGDEYYNDVHKPWESVKVNAGLQATDILHAAKIDISNKDLILGLSDFSKQVSSEE